jgi:hypothetical protein
MTPLASSPELGCSPHNPWRTVNGATAVVPSPVWFPGRRGNQTCRGAHSSFGREVSRVASTRPSLRRACDGSLDPHHFDPQHHSVARAAPKNHYKQFLPTLDLCQIRAQARMVA